MGVFDSVMVPCPSCGTMAEFQSKGGDCNLAVYELADAPPAVLADVNRHGPATCDGCGTAFAVRVRAVAEPVTVPQGEPIRLEPMPPWAIGAAGGAFALGAHLATRDGRRTGNAHIIDLGFEAGRLLATVLTDAGSTMKLSAGELAEFFHPPEWISNVDEVKRRFMRDGHDPR